VLGHRDLGTRVDGEAHDALGRAAERWEHRVDGGSYSDGPPSAPTGRTDQTSWWFVEPGTGDVLELGFEQVTEHVGSTQRRWLVVESGTRTVPAEHFVTDGYEAREGFPMQDIVDPGSPTTVVVAAKASSSPCPPLPPSPLRVSVFALGHVPHGFDSQPVETVTAPPTEPEPEATPARSVLALVHPDGRRIEVIVLTHEDPSAALAAEHGQADVEETTVLRCVPTVDGDQMTMAPTQRSVNGDRIVVGQTEWEYGALAVVGSGGASLDDVLAVLTGLQLVGE
jgi:hypothetical protein